MAGLLALAAAHLRYARTMRYADGGGLTAAERARREPVRLAAAGLPVDGAIRGPRPRRPLPRLRGAGSVRRRDPRPSAHTADTRDRHIRMQVAMNGARR